MENFDNFKIFRNYGVNYYTSYVHKNGAYVDFELYKV